MPAAPAINAGLTSSLALGRDGTLHAWGNDAVGVLGFGHVVRAGVPIPTTMSGAIAVSAGEGHTMALKPDGTVWGWRANRHGQLGDGTTTARPAPVQVLGIRGIVAVSSGRDHTVALNADGRVWQWGSSEYGQLLGSPGQPRAIPMAVPGLADVAAISAGAVDTVAVKRDGTVWQWGSATVAFCDGTPAYPCAPTRVNGLTQITAVDSNEFDSIARKSDGTVWTWSLLSSAPAAVAVAGLNNVTAVAAGRLHMLALKGDGTVWAWGTNNLGQLGDGTTEPRTVPVQVGGLTSAIAVSAGEFHSLALKSDGTVWAWGNNVYNLLGDGTVVPFRTSPVQVVGITSVVAISASTFHSVALKADGSVWGWGDDPGGDGLPLTRTVPAVVPGFTGGVAVSSKWFHALALRSDGTVLAWGENLGGQLGDGTLLDRGTPVSVPGLANAVAVAAASNHSAALKSDGTVWAWGRNYFGMLGDGTTTQRLTPVQVIGLANVSAISAHDNSTLALRSDGTVWSWGSNAFGQLGDGSTTDRTAPVQVTGLSSVVAVSAGERHAVALRGDGTVWGWGSNEWGQLGDGTRVSRTSPVQVAGLANVVAISAGRSATLAVKADGSVVKWGAFDAAEPLTSPAPVEGLTGVVAVSLGSFHALALRNDGSVVAWGANYSGELGNGTYVGYTRPQAVLADDGAGSLDTNDWYLDLDPAAQGTLPSGLVPRSLVVTQALQGGLEARQKYKSAEFGSRVGNYVLALVPPEFFGQVDAAPGSSTVRELRAKSGGDLVLAQLTPAGWTNVQGQLIAYSQGVANAAGGAAGILNRTLDSATLQNSRFCIGYGQTADAMLTAGTLREVLVAEGASATVSGVPCVAAGVYVGGPPASILGVPVTFTASVVGLNPGGSVQFRDGAEALASPVSLSSSNEAVASASITTSSLAAGAHGIGAAYSGDSQNAARTSEVPLRHQVNAPQAGPRVDLAGPVSSSLDSEVSFTVVVAGNQPTGTVQLKDGGVALGVVVPLVQGIATMRISSLAAGPHSIAASYSGDGANSAATSNTLPHTVYEGTLLTEVTLSSTPNPSAYGSAVTLTATVKGIAPIGDVLFRDGGTAVIAVPLTAGVASVVLPALAAGAHVLTADYGGDSNNQPVSSSPRYHVVAGQAPASGPNPFAFAPVANVAPGAAIRSNAIVVSGFASGGAITVAGGEYSIGCTATFTAAAGAIIDGQSVCVRHTSSTTPGASTLTTLTIGAVSSTFTSTTRTAAFQAGVTQLVTRYYQSILGRAPDTGGQAFWEGESARMAALGTDAREVFHAMAIAFFSSPEYTAFNRNDTAFVTDLYNAFFGRGPDASGLAFWGGQLTSGMPREVLLAAFIFSTEFVSTVQGALGSTAARAEVDAVVDFYRGLLSRLPDDAGLAFWIGRFRAAQCQGATALTAEVEAISSSFALSAEYLGRARSNAQYVGDLYNAFLRRGGDLAGVQFWIGQVASGAQTREQVRIQFRNSAEFQARVAAIIAQGCL